MMFNKEFSFRSGYKVQCWFGPFDVFIGLIWQTQLTPSNFSVSETNRYESPSAIRQTQMPPLPLLFLALFMDFPRAISIVLVFFSLFLFREFFSLDLTIGLTFKITIRVDARF
jgi:hypothetical protein